MKLFGYIYKVREDIEVNNRGLMGICDSDNYEIKIAVGLSQQSRQSVIVHEIIEAVKDHVGYGDIDHQVIVMIETIVFQVARDNGVDLSPLLRDINEADVQQAKRLQ